MIRANVPGTPCLEFESVPRRSCARTSHRSAVNHTVPMSSCPPFRQSVLLCHTAALLRHHIVVWAAQSHVCGGWRLCGVPRQGPSIVQTVPIHVILRRLRRAPQKCPLGDRLPKHEGHFEKYSVKKHARRNSKSPVFDFQSEPFARFPDSFYIRACLIGLDLVEGWNSRNKFGGERGIVLVRRRHRRSLPSAPLERDTRFHIVSTTHSPLHLMQYPAALPVRPARGSRQDGLVPLCPKGSLAFATTATMEGRCF